MAKKEFSFQGLSKEEVMALSDEQFIQMIPSKERRKFKRGLSDGEKKLIKSVKANKRNLETHCRDMVILPIMIGKMIKIHNGKEFVAVEIMPEMIGHRLGEFSITRKKLTHSAPGVGATKSSGSVSVK